MNVDIGIWGRLNRVIGFLLVLTCIAGVVVWYLPLIRNNEAMRKEINRLKARVASEEENSRRIENTIKALRTDRKAVERVAREKLGYVKSGETVIRFEAPRAVAEQRH
ncbi:MAG: septum formation initiator family protein [Verrucomicrobia bacterium]|nr:septum formation initiator family protein [Verrucomicrobiota bacterium]